MINAALKEKHRQPSSIISYYRRLNCRPVSRRYDQGGAPVGKDNKYSSVAIYSLGWVRAISFVRLYVLRSLVVRLARYTYVRAL